MAAPTIARWVGYDPRVLSLMEPALRRQVGAIGRWCLLPCCMLGASAAVGTWMTQKSLFGAVALGVIATGFVFNLFRVVIAGGGAALHFDEGRVQRWAPRLAPLVVFGLIAAAAAQPVHLLVVKPALDPQIERHRAELLERHDESLKRLEGYYASTSYVPAAAAAYRAQVAECEFVSERIALLWDVPEPAFLFTLGFAWIALMPLVLAHTFYLRALRNYELLRWRLDRQRVSDEEVRTQRRVSEALSPWSTAERWSFAARLVPSAEEQRGG